MKSIHIIRNLLITVISALSISLCAQNNVAISELEALNCYYNEHLEIIVELDYIMYSNHAGNNEVDRMTGYVVKGNNYSAFEIGPIESIIQDTIAYSIDHDSKAIVVGNISGANDNQSNPIDLLKSFIGTCDNWKIAPLSGDIKSINFECPYLEFKKGQINYNANTMTINKVVLYYNRPSTLYEDESKKPRLEIIYKSQKTNIPDMYRKTEKELIGLSQGKIYKENKVTEYQLLDIR